MTCSLRGIVVAVALLTLANPAHAWGRRAQSSAAYYYPASLVCVPVYPTAGVVSPGVYLPPMPPAGPAPVYATPTPAPAEGTPPAPSGPMPPAGTPGTAGVRETTSYYGASGATANAPLAGRSSVGFWNSTQRDMWVRVDSLAYRLPAGQGVTVDLPRRFTWQIDDRAAKTEELSEAAVDIVIRR